MNEKIICRICNKQFGCLTATHLKKHDISMKEYVLQYPDAELQSSTSRNKISQTLSGRSHGPMSEQHKQKISNSNKGKRISAGTEFKKGSVPWNKGLKGAMSAVWNKGKKNPYSKETLEQMSQSHTGVMLAPFSEERRRNMGKSRCGINHWHWRGGITQENKKVRNSVDFKLWREAVFVRDNWTCQVCNIRGGRLHPHHIKNFAQHYELRFVIDNGITLCCKCHIKFHKLFGTKDNNKEQLIELGII